MANWHLGNYARRRDEGGRRDSDIAICCDWSAQLRRPITAVGDVQVHLFPAVLQFTPVLFNVGISQIIRKYRSMVLYPVALQFELLTLLRSRLCNLINYTLSTVLFKRFVCTTKNNENTCIFSAGVVNTNYVYFFREYNVFFMFRQSTKKIWHRLLN